MSADDVLGGKSIDIVRRALTAKFKAAGLESPELDARLLIGAALKLDLTGLAIQSARDVTDEEATIMERFALRRIAREPVARILGRKEFWGLNLQISNATLVPRPDTETLVESACNMLRAEFKPSDRIRIADIGTGSGAILLALLSEFPDATGVGTDISADALTTAQLNAEKLGFATRATFVRCDYAAALPPPFDLIVSNPPYICSRDIAGLEIDVRDHDPHLALDGGADGLDAYRAIAPQAASLLASNGALIVEFGPNQAAGVSQIIGAAGLVVARPPRADLAGIPRALTGRKPSF